MNENHSLYRIISIIMRTRV